MNATDNLTALEIARIACDVENDGVTFYRTAARHADHDEARDIFEELGAMEKEHLNTFQRIYKQIDAGSGDLADSTVEMLFDDALMGYLKALSEGMVFPSGEEAEEMAADDHGIFTILDFAEKKKKSSILFYSEISKQAIFADSRTILERVIEEEKSHLVALNRLRRGLLEAAP